MPFALLIIGVILVLAAVNGTIKQLGTQLKSDFTGPNNFVNWLAAIGIIGSIGYIPALRTLSRVFLGLIAVTIILSAGKTGLFSVFQNALSGGGGSSATPSSSPSAGAPSIYPGQIPQSYGAPQPTGADNVGLPGTGVVSPNVAPGGGSVY